MASIRHRARKDGTPYWSVLYTIDGTQTSSTFYDKRAAEEFRDLINAIGVPRALELAGIERAQRSGLTVAAYIRRHIDNLTGVEKATRARYLSYLERDIAPHLGRIPLADLSRDDIRGWVNLLHLSGLSGKTIQNKHGFLSGALNQAVRDGKIATNPCEGNRLPRWDRVEMVFLTREEFRILKAAMTERYQPLVEFLVASGARWSEATALKPSDVDRLGNTVRITKAWKTNGTSGYTLGVPKTKRSVRTINIPAKVLDQLDYSHEWLFVNGAGNPVRIHSFHSNAWRPALKRAAKEGLTKRPRIHDLRHTCASWMIQAGVVLPVIQQHLGHESITTTVHTYGHLDRSSAEAAAAAIGEMLADN